MPGKDSTGAWWWMVSRIQSCQASSSHAASCTLIPRYVLIRSQFINQQVIYLLNRFLLKIQIQIYSMAMVGNLIHILRLPEWKRWLGRKLAYARCLSSKESEYYPIWHDSWGNVCSSRERWDWHYMDAKKINSSDDAGFLALLLNFRQV